MNLLIEWLPNYLTDFQVRQFMAAEARGLFVKEYEVPATETGVGRWRATAISAADSDFPEPKDPVVSSSSIEMHGSPGHTVCISAGRRSNGKKLMSPIRPMDRERVGAEERARSAGGEVAPGASVPRASDSRL
jgi:hypothetical protein